MPAAYIGLPPGWITMTAPNHGFSPGDYITANGDYYQVRSGSKDELRAVKVPPLLLHRWGSPRGYTPSGVIKRYVCQDCGEVRWAKTPERADLQVEHGKFKKRGRPCLELIAESVMGS